MQHYQLQQLQQRAQPVLLTRSRRSCAKTAGLCLQKSLKQDLMASLHPHKAQGHKLMATPHQDQCCRYKKPLQTAMVV